MSDNAYLTTNADVAAAYEAQAGQDGGMSADEFAQWHYENYGQNENRDGWGGGGGMLAQATEPAPAVDYRTQIQADLARLGGGNQSDLNTYLATTGYTPEQLAEVSGYNMADITSAIGGAKSAYGQTAAAGGQGAKGYLESNPDVVSSYYSSGNADNGMTLQEYAINHWQQSGAKEGQGISKNADGSYGMDAPAMTLYETKYNDDQLRAIAESYMTEMANTKDGPGRIQQAAKEHGISTDDIAYAVSKYGNEYKTYEDQQVPESWRIANMLGGGTKNLQAFREPTAKEAETIEFLRALRQQGNYAGNPNSLGKLNIDSAQSSGVGHITQAELEEAAQYVRSGGSGLNFVGANGQWRNMAETPNWRQELGAATDQSKAMWRQRFDDAKGKVSPFAAGGTEVGAKNYPGKGWQSLLPGLGMSSAKPQGSAQAGQAAPGAPKPGGVQSPAIAAAKAQALRPTVAAPTQIPASAQVNQNDFGINQKYAAEIKSDRASQALYNAYKLDIGRIDANPSLSPAQRDAAKQQAAQKVDRLLSYRKGA